MTGCQNLFQIKIQIIRVEADPKMKIPFILLMVLEEELYLGVIIQEGIVVVDLEQIFKEAIFKEDSPIKGAKIEIHKREAN